MVDPPSVPAFAPAFSLETPTRHGAPILDWVVDSTRAPARFVTALERHARALGVAPGKGSPDAGVDLYYAVVARHLDAGRPALRVYETAALSDSGQWKILSFDDIHARCTYRASWWALHGIGPGVPLCIVLPFGLEFAISVLAALRLGAVVSWLEPQGPDFVMRRLTALAPAHLATEPFLARQLGAFADIALPADALAPLPTTYSHTYAPGEVCLRWFSPLRAPDAKPVPVAADAVYTGALRDGLTCLALRPGDYLAAPGFHALQHQPALLFAAWVVGAGYIHINEKSAVRDPTLLEVVPVRTMGVTPRVRDAYVRVRRGHRPPWAHVVRNPEEACDWEAWRAFVVDCDLGETPISNLVIDAASAGALLASARRPGTAGLAHLQDVIPAPGRPWQLLDFTRSGQPAAADAGVYAPLTADKKPVAAEPQYLVLARRGAEYLYGGTLELRRCGRQFPAGEVVEVCARAAFLEGAGVVAVTSGGAASEARFLLVGFTGDEPGEAFDAARETRCAELCRLVAARLGAELVPDRIELFPLYARRRAGKVDPDWIAGQYLGGLLFHKAQTRVFKRLGALRRSLRAAAAPAPAATPAAGTEATWR